MHKNIIQQLEELIAVSNRLKDLVPCIIAAGNEIRQTLVDGKKLLTAGNGGSAADALHLAEELVGRFDKERPALPAIALNADPTLLTCIGNDYGFDRLFSRQIEGLGQPGDVLVVFTTSGNSNNILLALHAAKAKGIKTIALLGKTGGKAMGLADHEILIPSGTTARVQELHTFIIHSWLTLIESE